MRKLIVLVDMDDVLENLLEVWTSYLNRRYGVNKSMDDFWEWDMTKNFNTLSPDQIFNPLAEEELWKMVTPLPGAVEYLKRIIDDGHKVYIATSSHPDTVALKFNHVIRKYFPFISYEDIIVTYNKQLLRGDVLIDDNPCNLEGGAYIGLLMEAPHNRLYEANERNIVRVKSWNEIYKKICEIASR